MLSPLTEEEYKSTFGKKMINVTETAELVIDIWPYVQRLANAKIVNKEVFNRHLVEFVYRSEDKSFDHVLLPSKNRNVFVVIIIDLLHQNIKGHFRLDADEQYGLT